MPSSKPTASHTGHARFEKVLDLLCTTDGTALINALVGIPYEGGYPTREDLTTAIDRLLDRAPEAPAAQPDAALARMVEVIDQVAFENYAFHVADVEGSPHLFATYLEADIVTGRSEMQTTRKWRLSRHMTKSELVQTAFKCAITSMEHRTRESFKYRGMRVFGPHFDVDALHQRCKDRQFDVRPTLQPVQEPTA